MAEHPARTWLIVSGVVLVFVQAAVVLAWWLLPRWAPEQVVAYSPWPEPALRAWRLAGEAGGSTEIQQALEARLLDWGPGIGSALRYEFQNGDEKYRLHVIALASEVAQADGIHAGTTLPDNLRHSFSDDGIARLREDLVQLVLAALDDGSSYLPSNASYVAMSLRDPRTVPPACAFLAKQKPPIFEDLEPVVRFLGAMRDPRVVQTLIPLLPIRHKAHPTVEGALDKCLDQTALPHVIAATRHPHEVIRTWAAKQFHHYRRSEDLATCLVTLLDDPERQVRLAAIEALRIMQEERIGARFLEFAQHDSDPMVRQAAIMGLGHVGYRAAIPYLRTLLGDQDLHREAVISLGQLDDHDAIPHLLQFMHDPDKVWGLTVWFILADMPLTPEQRREYDAAIPGLRTPGSQVISLPSPASSPAP